MKGQTFLAAVLCTYLNGYHCAAEVLNQKSFPEGFNFGVATASYQIEGGWDADGKGENIWDRLTNQNPSEIADGSNGNRACDSYNKYKEDVQLIRALRADSYRFSLSWSRILPTGYPNVINPAGIRYYNDLIDELLAYNITPMVTLYHWDLPQPLQYMGGWPNPILADQFVDFARIAFQHFGDRVKTWITFNEPSHICKHGYGDGTLAPALTAGGIGDYMCVHTLLNAHAKAYHLYNETFRPTQAGIIGITTHSFWFEPASNSTADVDAAQRAFEAYTGIFTNPIFGTGDYPQVVKDRVAERSERQNFSASRLISLTADEIQTMHGTADFFGLNYYTALLISNSDEQPLSVVNWESDLGFNTSYHPDWPSAIGSHWLKITPWALRNLLNKIKNIYGNIPIYITENGYSDNGGLGDTERVNYYLVHLSACLDAIYEDGVNLVGYTAWSLLDNFEWMDGYTNRFGIHDVDFTDPKRRRTPKLSARYYAQVLEDRRLPERTLDAAAPTITTTTSTPAPNEDSTAVSRGPIGLAFLVALIFIISVVTRISSG